MHDFIKLLKTIKNFTSEEKELLNCDCCNQPTIRGKQLDPLLMFYVKMNLKWFKYVNGKNKNIKL